jgi:hypothetical protein
MKIQDFQNNQGLNSFREEEFEEDEYRSHDISHSEYTESERLSQLRDNFEIG